MCEESTEKRATSSFGFTRGTEGRLPDAQTSDLKVNNGQEAHVEAVRCMLMASREAKMEIPACT